ncbi:hypothetical protein Ani05nite_40290 [Amorphoplanes nipponensis]|uniref:Uncharacterized protein n=1 Tax=Actinoplanes nipponensis TaxID=135950 RepID=A0A919MUU3_9ACTN|nr:hypothetical protein Ani05nite_40290 [Actinoplanes nipponensis]
MAGIVSVMLLRSAATLKTGSARRQNRGKLAAPAGAPAHN